MNERTHGKIYYLLMPNAYKIIVFIFMAFIMVYSIGISLSIALTDLEEEISIIHIIMSVFFVWPLLVGGNFVVGLILNIIYIYILACLVYFVVSWTKDIIKKHITKISDKTKPMM